MWLLRATATIGGLTLVSRIAGLVREMLMANFLGAGVLTDVFNLAFRLPNLLRRIFAEGAFNAAFVPMFSGMLATEGKDPALEFAARVQSLLGAVLIGVCLVFIAAMPWVMHVYAFGYSGEAYKIDLAVSLSRIMFGYLLFMALTALLSGLLNSAEKYANAAFAPTLLNLMMIGGLLVGRHFGAPVYALAWSVLIAGVAQWVWLIVAAKRHGLMPKFVRPKFSPDVVSMLKAMAPVALGASVAQLNLLIDAVLATSLGTGAVSYLNYADRLNQLPLGIIGVGVGTALLPMLSKQFKEGRNDEARSNLNRAIEFTMLLSLPAAAALAVIAPSVIRVIYEHGAFTAEDTANTAIALSAFAIGLPSFVLIKVLAPGFFANRDTQTPFRIAIGCMILNTLASLALMGIFRHTAMAMATSLSGWVNAGVMAYYLNKRGLMKPDRDLFFRLPRLLLASVLMALILYVAQRVLHEWLVTGGIKAILALGALCGAGLGAYILACFAMKLTSIQELKTLLRRKTPSPEPDPAGMEG